MCLLQICKGLSAFKQTNVMASSIHFKISHCSIAHQLAILLLPPLSYWMALQLTSALRFLTPDWHKSRSGTCSISDIFSVSTSTLFMTLVFNLYSASQHFNWQSALPDSKKTPKNPPKKGFLISQHKVIVWNPTEISMQNSWCVSKYKHIVKHTFWQPLGQIS